MIFDHEVMKKDFGEVFENPLNYVVNQIKSFQSLDLRELRIIDANSRFASQFSLVGG